MRDDRDSDPDTEPDQPDTTGAADTVVSFDESDEFDEPDESDESDEFDESTDRHRTDRTEEPLGELATAVGTRGSRSSRSEIDVETPDEADTAALFEHEDVEGIDRDALWKQIQRGERETDTADESVQTDADREIREVQKRDYCHGCEHFENPPEVGCRHGGTDILEFPTLETVRVADCPVVFEEEALEKRR